MSIAEWGARAPHSRGALSWKRVFAGVLGLALVSVLVGVAFAWHAGYRAYAVHTGSMTPTMPVGSLVVDAPPPGRYQVGDVVTVSRPSDPDGVVTHRIHSIGPRGGIRTKGDANPKPDVMIVQPSAVIGRAIKTIPRGGYVLVYFSHLSGVLSLMTSALSLILLWGICFPSEEETPTRQDPPRIPRQRRGPLVRIPRQRTPGQPVSDPVEAPTAVQRRMPPTPAPYRRVPPTRPPLAPMRPVLALPVPRPRTA